MCRLSSPCWCGGDADRVEVYGLATILARTFCAKMVLFHSQLQTRYMTINIINTRSLINFHITVSNLADKAEALVRRLEAQVTEASERTKRIERLSQVHARKAQHHYW